MSSQANQSHQEEFSSPKRRRSPNLLNYLIVLFSMAFLLMLMSYFMQQRQNDQQVIEGLQESSSAMQTVHSLIAQNETLRNQLAEQAEQNRALTEQAGEKDRTILALDWLWRIEREFFQRRYSSTRELIRAFEETGLKQDLPQQPLVDAEYRTPLEQYESIYDQLF